ncbi:hypothetical protein PIB30_024262 [Stylosanthes scabra]|uniref:Uncharacterized protein n=1 Tax=Stylosanthes scabra TaxID=79078 RepID=A0ABU6U987_9FABA|nr:hypothetical protein [Stylosanthes scabra]
MERIGNVWGIVIQVDVGKDDYFNAFRVLVNAKLSTTIQAYLTVTIEGEDFLVMVREVGSFGTCYDEGAVQQIPINNDSNSRIEKKSEVEEQKSAAVMSSTQPPKDVGETREGERPEEETSHVEETQPTTLGNRDGARISWAGMDNSSGPIPQIEMIPSPTNTRTHNDDRRTEDLIMEAGLETDEENQEESDPSLPPGFENWDGDNSECEHHNIRLIKIQRGKKKCERNNASKRKIGAKGKSKKKKKSEGRDRKQNLEIEGNVSDSIEEISDTDEGGEDLHAAKTWKLGSRLGITSSNPESAKKYLRDWDDEDVATNNDNPRRRSRSLPHKTGKKVGVSKQFLQ